MTYLSKDEMSGLGLSRADIAAPSAIATKKDNRGRVIFMVRQCQRHNDRDQRARGENWTEGEPMFRALRCIDRLGSVRAKRRLSRSPSLSTYSSPCCIQ